MTSSGEKMGKTAKGAVWLDPARTSPYEYYQFWINTEDQDVERFLALFTFLPMEEVRQWSRKRGSELREAKEKLAFEATKITHGPEEAEKARETSYHLFYGQGPGIDAVPTAHIRKEKLEQGMEAYVLLVEAQICKSRGEARRLIAQGGVMVNDERVQTFDQRISPTPLSDQALLVKVGKKRFYKIVFD
jgi:tyrosyl-tRNA synthetase